MQCPVILILLVFQYFTERLHIELEFRTTFVRRALEHSLLDRTLEARLNPQDLAVGSISGPTTNLLASSY